MKRPCPHPHSGDGSDDDDVLGDHESKKPRVVSPLTSTIPSITKADVPGSWVFVWGNHLVPKNSLIQKRSKLPRVWQPHSPSTQAITHLVAGQCWETQSRVYCLDTEGHLQQISRFVSSSVLDNEEEEDSDDGDDTTRTRTSTDSMDSPKISNTTFSTLTGGHNHFAAIEKTTGYLYTWGRPDHGKLGQHNHQHENDDETTTSASSPPASTTTSTRKLCTFPQRVGGQLHSIPIQQVACGLYHTLALTKHHGHVFSWGAHVYGATGHPIITNSRDNSLSSTSPRRIETLRSIGKVVAIAAGQHESAAIVSIPVVDGKNDNKKTHTNDTGRFPTIIHKTTTSTRRLYTWGLALDGRLGHTIPSSADIRRPSNTTPRLVTALTEDDVQQVVCGDGFMMALTKERRDIDGAGTTSTRVWSWGKNSKGQCGIVQTKLPTSVEDDKVSNIVAEPTCIPEVHGIAQIGCRNASSWAITKKGEIYTWGSNENGKIGHGIEESIIPKPRQLTVMKHHHVVTANMITQGLAVVVDPSRSPVSALVPRKLQGLADRRFNDEPAKSDVSLLVDGESFRVHREVLAQRCPYFRTMFASGMRESIESAIELSGVQKHIAKMLLKYIYCDNIQKDLQAASLNDLLELYKLCDAYDMECLKEVCSQFAAIKLDVEQVGPFVQAAHMNRCEGLKEAGAKFVVENFRDVSQTSGFLQMSHEVLVGIIRGRDLK